MIEIVAPRLQRLFNDWDHWRRGREFPCRADFTPFDLKYIMGNLSLLDVTYDPLQFRYRIYASNLAQQIGTEMTNKSIDDIPGGDHARRVRAHFTEVVERRVPMTYMRDKRFTYQGMTHNCEVLVLPLSADGTTIDMLMSGVVWDAEGPEAFSFDDTARAGAASR
jgi:hypothetical protein